MSKLFAHTSAQCSTACAHPPALWSAGLFRQVPPPPEGKEQQKKGRPKAKKRRVTAVDPTLPLRVGDLGVLRGASKGGMDPDGEGGACACAALPITTTCAQAAHNTAHTPWL